MLLQKKNAVITGCNKGIGKKLVEVFSENGANINACVRAPDAEFIEFTKEIEKKNKNKVNIIKLDLSNKEEVKIAANEIISKTSSIDI